MSFWNKELTIIPQFTTSHGSEVYVTIQKNNKTKTSKLRVYEDGEYVCESDLALTRNGELPNNWQEILQVFMDDIVMPILMLDDELDYSNLEFVSD